MDNTKIDLPILETKSLLRTSCKECVFAIWEDSENRNLVQNGCDFSRLERFGKNGDTTLVREDWIPVTALLDSQPVEKGPSVDWTKLVFADGMSLKDCNDKWALCKFKNNIIVDILQIGDVQGHGKSYYEIERFCNRCRNGLWKEKRGGENYVEAVRKESQVTVSFVVFFESYNTLEQLEEFKKQILVQVILPKQVIIINQTEGNRREISNVIDSPQYEWKNNKPLAKCSNEYAFDNILQYITGQYITVVNLPVTIKRDFIERMEIAVNDRLERFVLLDADNLYTVQTKTAKALDGHCAIKLLSKDDPNYEKSPYVFGLKEKIKALNYPHLVKKLEEVIG